MNAPASVLILYNEPGAALPAGEAGRAESDRGVLREVACVEAALRRLGIRCRAASVRRLTDLSGALAGSGEPVVFNLVEGLRGTPVDFTLVPAVCHSFGKGVTGCSAVCQALCVDKWQTKAVLAAAGIRSPDGVVIPRGAPVSASRVPAGPLIVKPAAADASEGIDTASIVEDRSSERALADAVRRVHEQFVQAALVEQFIEGQEVNASVLQRGDSVEVLPLAEIDFSAFPPGKARIVDYSAKWISDSFEYRNTPRVIPARVSEETAAEIRRCALDAWHAVGCTDYARVDFRVDAAGTPYVLELNPNPDIAPDAGFAAALEAARIPYEAFVDGVVRNALSRLPVHGDATGRSAPGPGLRPERLPEGGANIRWSQRSERDAILGLVEGTGRFRKEEMDIAQEVLDDALRAGPQGHYQSYTAHANGRPTAWACYGPTPCTVGTVDIYWLVVDSAAQGRGIGSALLRHVEELIRAAGARLAVVETSTRGDYEQARRFYERHGYEMRANVRDFYAAGDGKCIYCKPFDGPPASGASANR